MKARYFVVIAALVATSSVGAQRAATSRTRPAVEYLASDKLEGRETGSPGERLAGDYIAMQLARAGAKPLPGHADMFMPFEFTSGTRDGGTTMTVRPTDGAASAGRASSGPAHTFTGTSQVQALSFSDDGQVTAPVVFAGYGLVVPDSQNFGYDSYAGLDVKDKVVLVLNYFPEDTDPQVKAALARYSDLRYKALAAREHGAKALLIVTGPNSPNAGATLRMTSDTALSGSGIPAASIDATAANALFAGAPKTLAEIQKQMDTGNPHVGGFALATSVSLTTKVVREKETGRNVLAYLPGSGIGDQGSDKAWVVVGAHYDHLGHGTRGTSLANKDEVGQIHHGADDNASGTAAVMAIAAAVAKQPHRRNILFALWSGEEIGLVGSTAFVNKPPVPLDQIAAYLNFDMVGRMRDNKLVADGTGSSPLWPRILERANVAAGFDLSSVADPYQPTDSASFNQAGLPSLFFTTGSHTDYHRPTDTADKIDYEDLDRIVDFAANVTLQIANIDMAPEFTKVNPPATGATLAGVRVTTGTIPDYTTEAKGLLLAGVIGGGPAEKAGLMKGDIIVEIAGQSITNIYDYTYALELLKADVPVTVVYMRAGERHEVQLTPTGRR